MAARRIVTTTTTPLGANGAFIGPWVDALRYKRGTVSFATDSATTQIFIQQSVDGTDTGLSASAVSAAATTGSLAVELVARYARVYIVAGATLQTRLAAALTLAD